MSTKYYIKTAIKNYVNSKSLWFTDLSNWYIGITEYPNNRFNSHDEPATWRYWEAESEEKAREIENHFLEEGMKGDDGGGKNPKYVYVYKATGPYSS